MNSPILAQTATLARFVVTQNADEGRGSMLFNGKRGVLSPFAKNYEEPTPNDKLMAAAREGNYRKLLVAVSEGADVRCTTLRKQTPLMLLSAVDKAGALESMAFLLDVVLAEIEAKDDLGWTPLMHACRNGSKDTVALLLDRKASVKVRALDGRTAPMLSTMEGCTNITCELIKQQAPIDKRDAQGWTVLCFACQIGLFDLVRHLLHKRANAKDKARDGTSTVMITAESGNTKIGALLLESGASLNVMNATGHTALLMAIRAHKELYADWLLDEDVDPTTKGLAEDPLEVAGKEGLLALKFRMGQFKPTEEAAELSAPPATAPAAAQGKSSKSPSPASSKSPSPVRAR